MSAELPIRVGGAAAVVILCGSRQSDRETENACRNGVQAVGHSSVLHSKQAVRHEHVVAVMKSTLRLSQSCFLSMKVSGRTHPNIAHMRLRTGYSAGTHGYSHWVSIAAAARSTQYATFTLSINRRLRRRPHRRRRRRYRLFLRSRTRSLPTPRQEALPSLLEELPAVRAEFVSRSRRVPPPPLPTRRSSVDSSVESRRLDLQSPAFAAR